MPEDVWYILPAKEIEGMRSVSLMTPTSKYERYREAWNLLHEAVGTGADEGGAEIVEAGAAEGSCAEEPASQFSPFSVFGRMEKAMKEVRERLGGGKVGPPRTEDEI